MVYDLQRAFYVSANFSISFELVPFELNVWIEFSAFVLFLRLTLREFEIAALDYLAIVNIIIFQSIIINIRIRPREKTAFNMEYD